MQSEAVLGFSWGPGWRRGYRVCLRAWVLIVWATEDRMMPRDHGRRLAGLFPDSRLVEIDDSYTLLAEDQPEKLTEAIGDFLAATGT